MTCARNSAMAADLVERGADAIVVGFSGPQLHVTGHLGGEFHHSLGELLRMGDDHERDRPLSALLRPLSLTKGHAPAALAAASSRYALEVAPGSLCPIERSPR